MSAQNDTMATVDSVHLHEAQLYLLATSSVARAPLTEAVEAALVGGVQIVQLREKTATTEERVALARRLQLLCAAHGARFVMNDDVDAAARVGAWGVHLGQEDLGTTEARARLPRGTVLGRSTHDEDELAGAVADQVDYVGVGSAFPTDTKGRDVPIRGPRALTRLASIAESEGIPAFAIGGIGPHNVGEVRAAGLLRVAVCAGILATDDPEAAARRFRDALA